MEISTVMIDSEFEREQTVKNILALNTVISLKSLIHDFEHNKYFKLPKILYVLVH